MNDRRHSQAIDAIRFLAAFCVVLHHTLGRPHKLDKLGEHLFGPGSGWLADLSASLWFGPAAVIVFFVVSGYCVHGPHMDDERVHVPSFYVRRWVRLLLPLAAIVVVGAATGVSYSPAEGVTWSLVCELAYYTAYPALRALWERYGLLPVIGDSYVVGYGALALSAQSDGNNSLLLVPSVLAHLPDWLLGCWLVEQIARGRQLTGSLPLARLGLVSLTVLVGFAHYRGIVSLDWSLPIYGALIVPWLWLEIVKARAPDTLASLGSWSYSLYLMHPAAFYGVAPLLLWSSAGAGAQLVFGLALIFLLSLAFYHLVERPSHRLARELSAAVRRRPPVPAV